MLIKIANFSENELKCRCGCGLFNMSERHIINLQALRYRFGSPLTVTSGCRCMKHNGAVGGVANSRHQASTKKADATDVTCDNVSELFHVAQKIGLFKEVIYYKVSNFVHISSFPEKKFIYFDVLEK
jgi:uncharacterized protein YcbK (DUF882 family)